MGFSSEGDQHFPGLLLILGLTEDSTAKAYDGVGGEDVCFRAEFGDGFGLSEGYPVGEVLGPG